MSYSSRRMTATGGCDATEGAEALVPNGGALSERLRIIRTGASKRAGRRVIAAEAGIIGVISVNSGRIFVADAADSDHYIVKNCDRIGGQNLRAVAAKRDVGNEIKLTVAPRRVKFQRRISRERAAADIEHAVSAKHAGFEDIRVSAGIIECDRSVAVDEGKERPAGIITAAIKIDRRGRRAIGPKNLESGIGRDCSAAGNIHVYGERSPMIVPLIPLSILESRLPPTDRVSALTSIEVIGGSGAGPPAGSEGDSAPSKPPEIWKSASPLVIRRPPTLKKILAAVPIDPPFRLSMNAAQRIGGEISARHEADQCLTTNRSRLCFHAVRVVENPESRNRRV